ncbi:hypothetical protein GE21DRAFT_1290321 [Neurospora crassa]|nr:hypothetical protein GE21DRAFT_1290321 [Neurospora crassa]
MHCTALHSERPAHTAALKKKRKRKSEHRCDARLTVNPHSIKSVPSEPATTPGPGPGPLSASHCMTMINVTD